MKISKNIVVVFLVLVLVGSTNIPAQENVDNSRRNAITNAIEQVSPAVASISVIQIKEVYSPVFRDPVWQYFFPYETYKQQVEGWGSGVVISPDGYVITNHHVVDNAAQIMVTLPDGNKHEAEIIGADQVSDLALLKLEGRDFPYALLGDSDDLIIGEWVIALGNPFGLFDLTKQPTASIGIISATHIDFGEVKAGQIYQDMVQTDAAINVGNSGGPLVNSNGEVIGINTLIYTGDQFTQGSVGIGFAIPINRARRIAAELMNTGRVDRSYSTGLEIQTLDTRMMRYLNLPLKSGVIITAVEPGSAAEDAGLKVGDVITVLEDYSVTKTADIFRIFKNSELRAGDKVKMTIYRDGKDKTVSMRLRKN